MSLQPEKFIIPERIWNEIIKHAKEQYPVESCGIIAGRNWHAGKFYPMKNIDNSGEHFMMEPAEQFRVVKDIRKNGLEMLAIYHSHPESPPRPSGEDIRLALTPGVVYLIVSLLRYDEPEIRGFIIEESQVREIRLVKDIGD